jgi:hypothetical protein
VERTVSDQAVTLSEEFAITDNTRLSVMHVNSGLCELDLPASESSGIVTIMGLEQELFVGDLFLCGESVMDDRTWRISSLKPIIAENKAEITAVVWSADILTRVGLVIL